MKQFIQKQLTQVMTAAGISIPHQEKWLKGIERLSPLKQQQLVQLLQLSPGKVKAFFDIVLQKAHAIRDKNVSPNDILKAEEKFLEK